MRAGLLLLTLILPCAGKSTEIELITIGPGTEFWSVFGHNALLLRQQDGRALIYNFGVFDPEEPGFLGRFLRGEPIYRLEAWPASVLASYRAEGRRIERQRLGLTPSRRIASPRSSPKTRFPRMPPTATTTSATTAPLACAMPSIRPSMDCCDATGAAARAA